MVKNKEYNIIKSNRLDLTNVRYGRLVCLESSVKKNKINKKITYWTCQCDCGKITTVSIGTLTSGNTKSCGCLHKEVFEKTISKKRKPLGEASFLRLLYSVKTKAQLRNYTFELTEEEFKILTKQNCHYCGIQPYQETGSKKCNGKYTYNGVDRKINNIGYTLENSIPCCGVCNKMKMDLDYDLFLEKCKLITKNHV